MDGEAEDGQGDDGGEDNGDDGGPGDRSASGSGCVRLGCLAGAVLAAGDPRRGDRLVVAVGGDEQPGGEVQGAQAPVNRASAAVMTRTSVTSAPR